MPFVKSNLHSNFDMSLEVNMLEFANSIFFKTYLLKWQNGYYNYNSIFPVYASVTGKGS